MPYDFKAAANAAKLGQTFAEANRSTKAGGAIRDISKAVMGATDVMEPTAKAPAKKSLLGKFDIKSMMPSKKAKAGASVPQDA